MSPNATAPRVPRTISNPPGPSSPSASPVSTLGSLSGPVLGRPELPEWVRAETSNIDLGDARLNSRFQAILAQFVAHPNASIPVSSGDPSSTKAVYRFLKNDNVSYDRILLSHHVETAKRAASSPVVLLVQDTTELDLTRPREKLEGAGPLAGSRTRIGYFCHTLGAFTPMGLHLGLVWEKVWARDFAELDKTKAQRESERKSKPIEQKESYRWIEGYQESAKLAALYPDTLFVNIGDSESDIIEYFECVQKAQQQAEENGGRGAAWIVRACQNRNVVGDEFQEEDELDASERQEIIAQLFVQLRTAPVFETLNIHIRNRDQKIPIQGKKRKEPRITRDTTVEIRAMATIILPPKTKKRMGQVMCNAVLVREISPPEGEEAIEWLLLTCLPISTQEEVRRVVDYYRVRWQTEVFFKILKSGCRVEASQLQTQKKFLAFLGLRLITAWRVMYVMMIGRECPDLPCDAVFEEDEWQAVYAVATSQSPPAQPVSLGEFIKLLGTLGGFQGGKVKDSHGRQIAAMPGPQQIWLGMQFMGCARIAWKLGRLHERRLLEPEIRKKTA